MKAILNWRYWIIALLFTIGIIAMGRAFGNEVEAMTDSEWLMQVAVSFGIGSGSFFALGKCIRHWEKNGDIPEFTNQ